MTPNFNERINFFLIFIKMIRLFYS